MNCISCKTLLSKLHRDHRTRKWGLLFTLRKQVLRPSWFFLTFFNGKTHMYLCECISYFKAAATSKLTVSSTDEGSCIFPGNTAKNITGTISVLLFSSSPLNKPLHLDAGRERPLKKLTCSRSPRWQVASLKPELGVLDPFLELPFLQGCRNFFICILTLNMSGAFPGGEQFMLQDYLLIQLIKFSPLALTQIFKNTSESNTVTPHGGTKANTCKTSVITTEFPKNTS